MLDLTPFGFTPTESHAYRALLDLGPSSGYAVARELSIARANAYQALDGLVTKGAAQLAAEGTPRRYRAVQPRSLFASLAAAETRKLDALEQQLLEQPSAGTAPAVPVRGERALNELAIRAIIRAEGPVRCIAPAALLSAWAPALRARAASGKPLEVWVGDAVPVELPVAALAANVTRVRDTVGSGAVLLEADGVLVATLGGEPQGIWSEAPILAGLVRAAIAFAGGIEVFNQPDS